MSASRRDRFLAGLDPERRALLAALPELDAQLDARLDEWVSTAGAAHGLPVDEAVLLSALAGAVEIPTAPIEVGDLYLAAACARADAAALRRFEAAYGAEIDRAIARSRGLGLTAAEFRQLVLDRLFVREADGPPRIASYRGKGTLKAWVRVMTSRLVVDLSRRVDRRIDRGLRPGDALAEEMRASEDTELDVLRHAYGPVLDAAFEQAVDRLTVRQRNLLRQRYLHGVSPDTLAKIYGVHRSTLFVWLDKSRAALLRHVREGLATRVPGDQLESVVDMFGSKLNVSVRRMLDSRLEPDSS